jgi:hypothetical protein
MLLLSGNDACELYLKARLIAKFVNFHDPPVGAKCPRILGNYPAIAASAVRKYDPDL